MNYQLLNGIITGILVGKKELYNPTYFYGPADMVKDTLYTIVSDYKEIYPDSKVRWVSGDDFVLELIQAVKDGTKREFRVKYRSCDLLVFDDVQPLSGRHAVMIDFYEIFDYVYMHDGQIILDADRAPADIAGLDDRIRNQLESGMVFHVN